MRTNALAALSLLCLTASASSNPRHQELSRRQRFFRDIGVAFSELFAPLPPHRPRPRKVVKRASSAVNANNQCVLRPANGELGGSSTSPHNGTTTSTSTSSSAASTLSSSSSSSTKTTSSSSSSSSSTTKTTKTTATPTPTPSSAWSKQFDSSGSDFFDNWSFFTDADPTHGNVQYVSQADAESGNLIEIDNSGNAIMRVETTPVVGTRKSVRIESNQAFTGGLWVLDATHMPTGCGTWPAWWTHGPNWPQNGEIDILEGVNENQWNQASLHVRDAGCSLNSNFGGTGMLGSTVCASDATSNQGCGIVDTNTSSYGAGFNQNNGGVYAMLWDDTGISVWFFGRSSIPKDIQNEAPNPSSWPTAFAIFPASTCAPFTYNQQHTTIFDTTLCGDWAGQSWNAAPNGGGQSCAASTGVATCADYVANNGGAFSEAYWKVKSMKIYQTNQ